MTKTKETRNRSVAPEVRPRRLRTSAAMRSLVAETNLRPEHLVAPFFVVEDPDAVQPIHALPGVSRFGTQRLLRELERALELGVRSAVLFGVVDAHRKNEGGDAALDERGPVATALREARRAFGNDLVLVTDVCLCGYTDHGHCGVLTHSARGVRVDNDASLARLARMAAVHAEAGADVVSPSDMMDGRVAAIRAALDGDGFTDVSILSYAVKYASAFYGPFREAAGSTPTRGDSGGLAERYGGHEPPRDRATYQMDLRNGREALREAALDEREGADLLMVKPALPYLDVIQRVRAATTLPVVAYNVSGEYAMIKAAAAAGALDEALAVRETLLGIRRAGADLILTYHALDALERGWLAS